MIENIAIIGVLIVILIDSIALIYYLNKQNAPVRTTVVQMYGLLILVPLVFVLAFTGKVGDNTIAAILGALIGYVFGKTGLTEEWTKTKQG